MALFTSTLGRMCTQFGTVATNEASARAGLNDSLYVLVVLVEVGVLANQIFDRIDQLGHQSGQLFPSRLGLQIEIDINVDVLVAGDRQRVR